MKYDSTIAAKNGKASYKGFLGINRRLRPEAGEFYDIKNMNHREYPCIRSEKGYRNQEISLPENAVINKLIIPRRLSGEVEGFSGIATYKENNSTRYGIYINNESKLNLTEGFTDAVDYNGCILALPDLRGYVYAVNSESQNDTIIEPVGYSWDMYCTNIYNSTSAKDYTTQLNLCKVPNSWYVNTFCKNFAEGDKIKLYGLKDSMKPCNTIYPKTSVDYSNISSPVSIVIKSHTFSGSASSGTIVITVEIKNVKGETIPWPYSEENVNQAQYGAIKKYVPKVTYACVAHNRVWCCSENGEEIFASALGKPLEYYEFNGVSTDSWNASVGTPGKFTGIALWQTRVVAFKEDYVHIIYGSTANDFSIERTYGAGCIDRQSIANAGDMLIWLSYDGFYAYSGGKPQRISDKLNARYVSAVSFSDGICYYARCQKENGDTEFLVFDTEKGVWTGLTDIDVVCADYYKGKIYFCTKDSMYIMKEGKYGDFCLESPELTFETFNDKSFICASVRCKINDGFINFYTSVNGGQWISHKGISEGGRHKLPIRYSAGDVLRFRIEGSGDVIITEMEFEMLVEERS